MTDSLRYLRILHYHICGQLIQTCFTDKQLVVGKVIGLYHVNLLFYLLGNLRYLVFIAPRSDGVLMHTLNAGCRYVQTLNIHLPASKHSRNLIQNTSNVL